MRTLLTYKHNYDIILSVIFDFAQPCPYIVKTGLASHIVQQK